MTISSTTNRVSYTGNGTTTVFAFAYKFFDDADLAVYQAGTLKTLTTHYTVSGAGDDAGGSVTFLIAPANGEEVVIVRDPAITQETDLVENDPLPAETLENSLDRLTIICQRLDDRISRSMTLSDSDVSSVSLIIPSPESNKILGWNAGEDSIVNITAIDLGAGVAGVDFTSPNGTESLTNKTITVKDANLTIQDNLDTTKQVQFQASGITTGTTRTVTFPDENFDIGFRNVPQNSQSADYTAVLADSGKHLLHPSADVTARTFTIPANASVAYSIGTALTFVNQASAGVMTIAITSDTMRLAGAGTTGSRTLAANGIATAIKITATEWLISGTGLT